MQRSTLGMVLVLLFLHYHATRSAALTSGLITNGDFETGNLQGWTTFVTSNGSLTATAGLPDVVSFDVSGDGSPTSAARFQVGQASFVLDANEGGGILQSFVSPTAEISIHADIASDQDNGFINLSPGTFSLSVDGFLLDEVDFADEFGWIGPYQTQRFVLDGSIWLDAGVHELRFLFQRSGLNSYRTPYQYIDNVSVTILPEPTTFTLLGLGSLALVMARRQK